MGYPESVQQELQDKLNRCFQKLLTSFKTGMVRYGP
jgi:hypothetical protein